MSELWQTDLFTAGLGGYHTYRIPALAVTTQGTLLAFCEGRKNGRGDAGHIDLLLRRSFDHGRTWDAPQVVTSDPPHTTGNPAPVIDRTTGRIILLYCWNRGDGNETAICAGQAPRTVWITHSDDDGTSWAAPREITDAVKDPTWTWYATGPCHGIQLAGGRLLIPCDHIVGERFDRKTDPHRSHVIFSDDHGATWQIGGILPDGSNECAAVETTGGAIYLNCRDQSRSGRRIYGFSHDGGMTFPETGRDATLIEPTCQGSMARFTVTGQKDGDYVLFANPASDKRERLTVRLSSDQCRTWSAGWVLQPGPAAYSDLCVTANGQIACLYECGDQSPYERLTLALFSLEWLTAAGR